MGIFSRQYLQENYINELSYHNESSFYHDCMVLENIIYEYDIHVINEGFVDTIKGMIQKFIEFLRTIKQKIMSAFMKALRFIKEKYNALKERLANKKSVSESDICNYTDNIINLMENDQDNIIKEYAYEEIIYELQNIMSRNHGYNKQFGMYSLDDVDADFKQIIKILEDNNDNYKTDRIIDMAKGCFIGFKRFYKEFTGEEYESNNESIVRDSILKATAPNGANKSKLYTDPQSLQKLRQKLKNTLRYVDMDDLDELIQECKKSLDNTEKQYTELYRKIQSSAKWKGAPLAGANANEESKKLIQVLTTFNETYKKILDHNYTVIKVTFSLYVDAMRYFIRYS